MRERFFQKLGEFAGQKTWWMFAVILIFTVIFGIMAVQLEMSMNLTSLLPEDDPMVEEFNYIFKEFNGASTAFIAVQGEPENMIAFAEHISPIILDLENWIKHNGSPKVKSQHQKMVDKVAAGKIDAKEKYYERVDFKQPLGFIRDHGIMLIKPDDLKNIKTVFTNPNLLPYLTNLNNSLEKEYIQSETKISTIQKERSAVQFLDGIESWIDDLQNSFYQEKYTAKMGTKAAESVAIGNPYLISPDRSMMLIMATPMFNMIEVDYLLPAINGLEEMVKTEALNFNVSAGLAGGIALAQDEFVAGTEDSMSLTILALIAVLIMFIVTFRMWAAPLLAILNLIIGITWAMGVSWLLVDTLNMFTAMMAVVLVGLGIDFSIHIISVFSEFINKGVEPQKAIIDTLKKVGSGIVTGGFTTAAAFLTLMIGRSEGISEFGLVCGAGLIMIMISTLLTMPTLLMIRERYRKRRSKYLKTTKDVSYKNIGLLGNMLYKKWQFSLFAIIIATVILGVMISRVTMDYNYLNMEPEGLESILLNDQIIEKFNMSSDAVMMTARSLEQNREYSEAAKQKSSVSLVVSISDYLPNPSEQKRRKPNIAAIYQEMDNQNIYRDISAVERKQILEELFRLEANVIEMQDMAFIGGQDMVDDKATRMVGNPDKPEFTGNLTQLIEQLESEPVELERLSDFNRDFGAAYQALVLDMADTNTIVLADLPQMITARFLSERGDRFLITLYPKGDVWQIDYLKVFSNDALDITSSISGTPPMFYFLLKIIGEDGKRAAYLTLLVVFLFLWFDLKSITRALLAMIPLSFGVVWMLGFMGITGIQITLLNIMAIPLIIGIGIDDGVHILHRYKIEGNGAVNTVYRSTGKAIIITSLTTMLSFGSLVFATYRGFGSLGIALFIGVGMCLLTSVLVLPSVLGFLERKGRKESQ